MTDNSSVVQAGKKLAGSLSRLGARAAAYTRASRLYGWLTKEPEPEVIVIDLRETRTVGPFVRLLDRTVERVGPYWRQSRAKAALDRTAALVERGLRTRPGQLLVALLEPPEVDERSDAAGGERSDAAGGERSDSPERTDAEIDDHEGR